MIDAFFIAGTDTDVGKTVASKAILQAIAAKGLNTIGYKPVAAGSDKTEAGCVTLMLYTYKTPQHSMWPMMM